MAKSKDNPELTFQRHIGDFLIRQHEYGVLEQTDITDTENSIAEDQLWAFLNATQVDTLKKLTEAINELKAYMKGGKKNG